MVRDVQIVAVNEDGWRFVAQYPKAVNCLGASQRAPAVLVRQWVRDKLAAGRAREPENPTVPTSEPDDGREDLRQRYRPTDIVVLFVGEAAPAGGSFFYEADSNLFFATREACDLAFRAVPEGRAFLRWFKAHDFWLYDLSTNRSSGSGDVRGSLL